MGVIDDITRRVQSDLTYKAGSGITSAITDALKKKTETGKKCPKCGKPLTQDGLKFCPSCGAKLVLVCPKCNIDYPNGTKFCTQCGEALK